MTRKPGPLPPLRAVAEARLAHGPATGNIADDLLHEIQVGGSMRGPLINQRGN